MLFTLDRWFKHVYKRYITGFFQSRRTPRGSRHPVGTHRTGVDRSEAQGDCAEPGGHACGGEPGSGGSQKASDIERFLERIWPEQETCVFG